jgi:putative tricarboxylic transport membrane protein
MSEDVTPSREGPGPDSAAHTNKFRGGLSIALFSLLLLFATLHVTSPAVPRALAILAGVAGIAVMMGFIRVRGPQDFYGGIVLLMVAIFALIASGELPGQRGFAFGPGTAPRLFAGVLAAISVAVALVGVFSDGPPIEKYKIKGPALVVFAIFLFAALIRPFGLIIATFLAFLVSIMGSSEMRWLESVIAGAVMTAFCVVLFVYLLNLPFQLWPQPYAHVILFNQFAEIVKQSLIIFEKLIPGR